MRTDTLAHLVTDFELGAQLHPELGRSLLHVSLSFNPDDAARMTDHKMRQIAEEYMEEMGMTGTQYLMVRHRDRPHKHLHIMATRVANDGHTIPEGNNYLASKRAVDKLVVRHRLSPATERRPDLQHPERLRGRDLNRFKLRTALDQELVPDKHTQRPALLAALAERGIAHQEFRDNSGNVRGISFKMGGYACKGSALGPEYSSTGIDRRLAANQQQALKTASQRTESTTLPAPAAATVVAEETRAAPVVSVCPPTVQPAREEAIGGFSALLQSAVKEVLNNRPTGPAQEEFPASIAPVPTAARLDVPQRPEACNSVAAPLPSLIEATAIGASVQAPEHSAPVPPESAASPLPKDLSLVEAAAGGELLLELVTPLDRPADPNAAMPAKMDDVPPVETATAGSAAVTAGTETEVVLRYLTPAEEKELDRKLAAWEKQQAEQAQWEAYEDRYYDLRAEVIQKIGAADQATYHNLPAFEVLMQAQGLALLPAQGEEPIRVVHQSSGEMFPAEDLWLAGRPFLETVHTKAAQAAEAAARPPIVDWESRYQQYMQERATVIAHNSALLQVSWLLEDSPNAAGVRGAITLVKTPGTPLMHKDVLLENLQVELTRQQDRENEIGRMASERKRLEEAAKKGFGLTLGAMAARTSLLDIDSRTPLMLPINVGEKRFLKPEPSNLTREQFVQLQQPGLDQVRAVVKTVLAAGFTQWNEFKSRVDYSGIETELDAGKVAFRHKASGQTYRSEEVTTNFYGQYVESKDRGLAHEAKQPQKSAPAQSKNQEISR
ncbi:hypothetical protein N008_20035 [Hymenobacter sp. APR13]|nr:hypothetical protein N008_20035 [Hymenobacter sp. APR13]